MTDAASECEDLPRMPFDRGDDMLAVPPVFSALRPVARVRTLAGDPAWLVSGYAEARALFGDERLGRSHPEPEKAARISNAALFSKPLGDHTREKADRARFRRLLSPAFGARRMNRLRNHIEELVTDLLDALAKRTPPADLHEALSAPLPSMAICELLGVPYADRPRFSSWSSDAVSFDDPEKAAKAYGELLAYMHRLIVKKREEPGEDIISDLVAAAESEGLDDGGIAMMAAGVLFAGHETTVNRIDFGVLLFLLHPEQRAMLVEDPGIVPAAVEEVLRYAAPSYNDVVPRYAHTDIEMGDLTIKRGEALLLATTAADRDPRQFPDPERFDITREPSPHLAFGHGPRFCLGSSLARVQLQTVFPTLFTRFPTLELAVAPDELRLKLDTLPGGLVELPVTWRP
jgi:cytochrome P450